MGPGEPARLPGRRGHAPPERMAAAPGRRLGSLARRKDERVCLRGPLLLLPADRRRRPGLRRRPGERDLQLQPDRRHAGRRPRQSREQARDPGRAEPRGQRSPRGLPRRADDRRRAPPRPHADDRPEGELPRACTTRSRTAATSTTTPREARHVQCAMVDPGGDGKYARGDFYYCTGVEPGQQLHSAIRAIRRASSTGLRPRPPPNGSTRESSSSRARRVGDRALAPGLVRLLDAARKLRRRRQRRPRRPDRPRHQSGLRLRDAPAELHRPPVSRPARRLSPRRLLSDAPAALGGFRRLRDLRRAARHGGVTSTRTTRRASCREARPGACRRSGRPT